MSASPLPTHCVCLTMAIEVDLAQHASGLSLPTPIDKSATSQLADLVAADLNSLLGDISGFGCLVAGALYEQPQLLTPDYAVFNTLRTMYRKAQTGGDASRPFQPGLMALGASGGEFPDARLNPEPNDSSGPMLLIPILIVGEDEQALAELSSRAEEVLINQGQVRPETAIALIELFGINPLHARYMTLHDLCAMLSMQLTHIGLSELWTLLDAQLLTGETVVIASPVGNRFVSRPGGVDLTCMGFDDWARVSDLAGDELSQGYARYIRIQRQVVTAMKAHHIPFRLLLLSADQIDQLDEVDDWGSLLSELDGFFVRECPLDGPATGQIDLTEQSSAELGTIAYTVQWQDNGTVNRLEHYYPLRARGLQQILDHLKALYQDDLVFNFPGGLCIDPEQRRLISA